MTMTGEDRCSEPVALPGLPDLSVQKLSRKCCNSLEKRRISGWRFWMQRFEMFDEQLCDEIVADGFAVGWDDLPRC